MKFFSAVFLSLVCVSCVSFQTAFSAEIDSEFLSHLETLKDSTYISTPEQTHQPLYDAFASAKKTIKVGIFSISSQAMADNLSAAAKRGIAVTVICDSMCFKSTDKMALIDQLKTSGVQVFQASTGFSISHWKTFIIDDEKAFISTMNWVTRTGQMRDMGIFLTNPSIIAEMLAVFNQDIENSKNQTAITPPLSQPNLVWSPVNSENKLVALINSAKSTIEIWIENMGEKAVHDALREAIARKVKVRVLTSVCGLGMPGTAAYPILKELSGFGVEVKGMPFPANSEIPYIHAKVIMADQKTTFLGSENFSFNSLLKARELGLIFEEPAITSQMQALYEKDWAHSVVLPDQPPAKCSALTDVPKSP